MFLLVVALPSWKTHVFSGVIGAVTLSLILASTLSLNFLSLDFWKTQILSTLFFILGSDLPDIDHDNSLIRRYVIASSTLICFPLTYLYTGHLDFNFTQRTATSIIASLIVLLLGWTSKFFTKHRGHFHSVTAAIIYGSIIYIASLRITTKYAYLTGIYAFIGYILHLILDKTLKIL